MAKFYISKEQQLNADADNITITNQIILPNGVRFADNTMIIDDDGAELRIDVGSGRTINFYVNNSDAGYIDAGGFHNPS